MLLCMFILISHEKKSFRVINLLNHKVIDGRNKIQTHV